MSESYKKAKEYAGEKSLARSRAGREIGDIPPVANPERKAACERNFRLFCESYFAQTFNLAWSEDHLRVIEQVETVVLRGGLFAIAMPRGSGKTSIAEVACQWATLYGHRDFVVLIGCSEERSKEMLDSIKIGLETNDLLFEDFPEVAYPIRCLEGVSHRCKGQLHKDKQTHIGWKADEVILPSVPGSKASAAIIKVTGITGGIRGMKFKRPDGRTVRPSLVVPDDPQTDESARSPSQCERRESILAGAILGLAGPGKKIAGIMPCTVIAQGDMADNILDRKKHPVWNGIRTKLVYAFPENEKLWAEYTRLHNEGHEQGLGNSLCTKLYAANREEMDRGAIVPWAARFDEDELSAVQSAMNLKIRNEKVFFAEYQNEPMPEQEARTDDLTHDQIASKVNRIPRGVVPVACNAVTAFIDVQGSMLFWVVCAWEDNFTGYVIDYGAFPDQKQEYFTLQSAKIKMESVVPNAGLEGQIYGGLELLTEILMPREWTRDDGAAMKIDRCVIDANWGTSTQVIKSFCRQSAHSARLTPSHGKYIGAGSPPMDQWPRRAGEKSGLNWRMRSMESSRSVRSVIYDTNFWKSFIHARLSTAMGDKGCLTLFGDRSETHRLLADHICSEYRERTEGRGRVVDEWRARPGRFDNHWFDGLVGCAMAASMQGVALPDSGASKAAPRAKRVSFSEMQRQRRA